MKKVFQRMLVFAAVAVVFCLSSAYALQSGCDLDGDGRPDLIVLRKSHGEQVVQINFKDSHVQLAVGTDEPLSICLLDEDGDHDTDILLTRKYSHEPVGLWFNDGEGHFEKKSRWYLVALKLDAPAPLTQGIRLHHENFFNERLLLIPRSEQFYGSQSSRFHLWVPNPVNSEFSSSIVSQYRFFAQSGSSRSPPARLS